MITKVPVKEGKLFQQLRTINKFSQHYSSLLKILQQGVRDVNLSLVQNGPVQHPLLYV